MTSKRTRTSPRGESTLWHALGRIYPLGRRHAPLLLAGLISALLASLIALFIPQALQWLVNGPLTSSPNELVLWLGVGLVVVLGVLEAAFTSARRQLVITPGNRFEAELRVRLYRHLSDLGPEFHDRWGSGQLLTRSISDIRRFRRWLSLGLVMTVVNVVTIVVGIGVLVFTSPVLGLVYLAAAVPAFLISQRARRDYHDLSRRSQDQAGDLGTTIEESVHGIRVLKAFGRELEALAGFSEQATELRSTEIGKARSRARVTLVMLALPETALAVILGLGIVQVSAGELSVGALLAFFATAGIIAHPLERLSEQFAMSMEAKTAIDRYFEVLDSANTLPDPVDPVPVPDGPGEVRLRDVHFAYPDPEAPAAVLQGVDLLVRPGETLALVGLTGSGKSTLAQLVPRFYDPDHGTVEIDGVDVRRLRRHELRQLVSIAFEDSILFSASVRENLAFGVPEASDEQIWTALEVAQAEFVRALPEGLETRIGEEGMSLSGGQRQRLSLARAILVRPRVLVLDDPLSALDVRTEAAVTGLLRHHLAGTTTIVVAHRPSTVELADRVAVLHEGVITAIGTHSELLASNSLYRSIIAAGGRSPADGEQLLDPRAEPAQRPPRTRIAAVRRSTGAAAGPGQLPGSLKGSRR